MRAIVIHKYGPPDSLSLEEVQKPSPGKNEVLMKVHATAINDWDWSFVRGKPFPYRLFMGLFKPNSQIPGMELAGIVEEVGEDVDSFKPGEKVYGDLSDHGFGSFAEYACVNESSIVLMPEEMTFIEAATIPHASLLAYQGLIEVGMLGQGWEVLINGAGGGMGTFGLQIAKEYDAVVTGVDSGDKLEMLKEVGYDHVIDYRKEDFTKNGRVYDLILDAKTTRIPSDYSRSLKSEGKYVSVGGDLPKLLQLAISRLFGRHKNKHILALKPNIGLNEINRLYRRGKIRPVVDGPYKLEDIPRLIQFFGEGKHKGKIVVLMTKESE